MSKKNLVSFLFAGAFSVCLSIVGSHTAFAATINVTTFTDEDSGVGVGSGCGIYEAVQAANSDATYGGCTAGSGDDLISVPSGTYTMPAINSFSTSIAITDTVTLEGASSVARPIIDGSTKFAPAFLANAPGVEFRNFEFIDYRVANWDVTFTNRDLVIENVALQGGDVNTSCDGLIIRDVQMSDGAYIGIFANDALVDGLTGIETSFLDLGVTGFANSGGDRIIVRDVDFSDGSMIYVEKNGPGDVLLENIKIDAPDGDGLFIFSGGNNDDGTTTLRRVSVSNVVSDNAVYFDNANSTARHQLVIEDSYFHDNDAAVFTRTSQELSTPYVVIRNSVFKDNGTWDSAVYLDDGYVTIVGSSFINNSTTEPGSGLFSSARLDLTNSVFYNNSTNAANPDYPAGAFFYDSVRYEANSPAPQASRIINNTFANNTSNFGAAVYIADYDQNTTVRDTQYNPVFINNLFSGNSGSATCLAGGEPWYGPGYQTFPAVFGASSTHNMSTDASCSGATVTSNAMLDSALTSTTTAQVGYQSEGGHTQMLKLLVGSPAIDTGSNVSCPLTDITLNARPLGDTCDIGAFETLGVSTGGGGGSPSTPSTPGSGSPEVPGVPNTGAVAVSVWSWLIVLFALLATMGIGTKALKQ